MLNYRIWGEDQIDPNAITQMNNAASIPPAVAGALMPDAHVGYGLPIGGVLALDNAVCPYAVGVDIACRMKLSIFEIDPSYLESEKQNFVHALQKGTFFGIGVENNFDYTHPVLTKDWDVSPITKENQAKARRQLGTSGSGNHFVEFGVLTVPKSAEQTCSPWADGNDSDLDGVKAVTYIALMSHSGSRGTGAAVCDYYSKIAKQLHPEFGDLGWLDLDTDIGREYWNAMNLMGEYSAANHDCIHNKIAKLIGVRITLSIENHHNFAWKEVHNGREVIVHRKGATPAGRGVLGVIPGSMGTTAFVVRGKGNAESLCSASHGAGRVMSRKLAKKTFDYKTEIAALAARGITVISADSDEVCGVYKDIHAVMAAQTDLVSPVAEFSPVIVKMCGGGDRAED